jgi:L-lactate dehydrogenase (cytochrome)/(S)-mandelate dehydrogenase
MTLDDVINLHDLQQLARRRLPRMAYDFIAGGADDEQGLQHNRAAFERWRLLPRFLVDVSQRDASVELFGQRYALPVGISPMGLAGLFRPGADALMAQAAASHKVPFIMSGASCDSLETAARIAPDHAWFQIYRTLDEKINEHLVGRARDAGLRVLVITVDVTVNSNRERNRRNGFVRPFRLRPSILLQCLLHPRWSWQYWRGGGHPMMENWQPYAPAGASAHAVADLFGRLTPAANSTWHTLERIRRWWPGRLVVKGLLHPDDARQAVALGADGIIVSNHGARQLDLSVSPLDMLPEIRAAVPATPLILDSGVRRGSDVVIARCLGAQMALCGRPMMYAVAAAGAPGVGKALDILQTEIDKVLAQLGCARFDELGPQQLRPRSPVPTLPAAAPH